MFIVLYLPINRNKTESCQDSWLSLLCETISSRLHRNGHNSVVGGVILKNNANNLF